MSTRIKELYLKAVERDYAYDSELVSANRFTSLIIADICEWLEGVPTSEEGMMLLTQQFIIANLKSYYGVEK